MIFTGTIAPLVILAAMSVPSFANACTTGCGTNGFFNGVTVVPPTVVTSDNSNTETVTNANTATVTNTVTTSADTGNNTAYGGTASANAANSSDLTGGAATAGATTEGGTIATGDASAESDVLNTINSNETSIAPPTFASDAGLAGLAASGVGGLIYHENNSNETDVTNSNDATVSNPVATTANTGGNVAYGGAATASAATDSTTNGVLLDPFNSFFNTPFYYSSDCNSCDWQNWNYATYEQWLQSYFNGLNAAAIADPGVSGATAQSDGGQILTGDVTANSVVKNYLNNNQTQM